jgi:CO/xanthine dehydrogenase FAD-binding subunit
LVRYAKPMSLDEALDHLAQDTWRVFAGGTDVYPSSGARPIRENVLDINGLSELRGAAEMPDHLVIGARTTWTDIVRADLPPCFRCLQEAAREVGSVQIQNMGTIAGNLCNASPAADGVPPLLVLDADVELRSVEGVRHVALGDFILGNRKIARHPNELVTAIRIPRKAMTGASKFHKLGSRRYLVISIAMTAARIAVDDKGLVVEAGIAVGSCSAVAKRLRDVEAALVGQMADATLCRRFDEAQLADLQPIDDVRASAEYRKAAALQIVRRTVDALVRLLPTARECAA